VEDMMLGNVMQEEKGKVKTGSGVGIRKDIPVCKKVEQTETTDDRCTNEGIHRRRNQESKRPEIEKLLVGVSVVGR
jgi:hypothetical protein